MNYPPTMYSSGFTGRINTGHYDEFQEGYCAMPKSAWRIATLGRSFTIYMKTRKSGHSHITNSLDEFQYDYTSLAIVEWESALGYLKTEWKISRLGCILFIPLSVALLQIDAVSQDVLARTAVIAAFIFSIAGLVLSASFMALETQFSRRKCRNVWAKASRSFDSLESVEFWSLLAFPMALLIWSVILCVITVLILAWNTHDGSLLSGGHAKVKTIISASFLMVLGMTLAAFMYRCKQITRRLF